MAASLAVPNAAINLSLFFSRIAVLTSNSALPVLVSLLLLSIPNELLTGSPDTFIVVAFVKPVTVAV